MGAFLHRRRRTLAIAFAVVVLAAAVVAIALSGGGNSGGDETSTTADTSTTTAEDTGGGDVEKLADGVILAGFDGGGIVGDVADHPYGGVLFRSGNWDGAKAGGKLTAAIRDAGSKDGATPPLIAVAQEGGPYRELDDLPPDQREVEIGDAGKTGLAESWMGDSAKALDDVGFDLDLAPIADVATLDSPIADRAFSDDAQVAANMTAAAIKGCEDADVACAPAHFPGLGGASQSTDAGPASVGIDAATLSQRDLAPFRAAFDAGAPAVVVSSAFYTAYDPVTPASLTPAITTDLLRGEVKFEGVAISDDLSGAAITATTTPADAAVRALGAGIDLVQVSNPNQVGDVRKAIEAAVADGSLSLDRLQEAAGRVQDLKDSLAAQGGDGDKDKGDKKGK